MGGGVMYGYIYMLAFFGGGCKREKSKVIHSLSTGLSTGYPQAKKPLLKQKHINLFSSMPCFVRYNNCCFCQYYILFLKIVIKIFQFQIVYFFVSVFDLLRERVHCFFIARANINRCGLNG